MYTLEADIHLSFLRASSSRKVYCFIDPTLLISTTIIVQKAEHVNQFSCMREDHESLGQCGTVVRENITYL